MRNLLVVSCGPQAYLTEPGASFDVLNLWWAQPEYHQRRRWNRFSEERKFAAFKHLADFNWSCYSAVALIDDDLIGGWDEIFSLFHETDMRVGQPAITGHVSHDICKPVPDARWRSTTFVEVQCPIFAHDALEEYLPYFDRSEFGWGLEALWATRELAGIKRGMAMLDSAPVAHTRPIRHPGGEPAAEMAEFHHQYGVERVGRRTLATIPFAHESHRST